MSVVVSFVDVLVVPAGVGLGVGSAFPEPGISPASAGRDNMKTSSRTVVRYLIVKVSPSEGIERNG